MTYKNAPSKVDVCPPRGGGAAPETEGNAHVSDPVGKAGDAGVAGVGLVAAVVATAVLSNERLRDALSMTLQAPALMEIPESELDAELRYQRSKRR
ncbi:hypothetical protein T484DRAFT_1878958 [Baffinella frigidus]|nr:hypothetical protein T484DRAFT_1878958 [Cryptophyta sp. CCMP2293]